MNQNPNIALLEAVVDKLGSLTNDLVFVGGCAAGLLLTDPAAPTLRTTLDVDVITEVNSRQDYYRLSEELRAAGFSEDTSEDAPICRWRQGKLTLDVMPTDPELLGFGSIWYKEAFESAAPYVLPSGTTIRLIASASFIACKLAALENRAKGDLYASHDMEDIVSIIDGRVEAMTEIRNASHRLREFVATAFRELLHSERIEDVIASHLPGDAANQARGKLILDRMQKISSTHL